MHATHTFPREGGAVSRALPWEWFDFSSIPRAVDASIATGVEDGGAGRAWRVLVDGRTIPFKLLRRRGVSQRPVLVMLHGMGLTIASFHGVAAYLLETHDLALIDYSSLACALLAIPDGWPHGGLGLRVMTEAVWAVADALGVEQVDLAGNSLGGALCLVAALQKPKRVRRMMLANPACYPQELPRMYRIARVPIVGEFLMSITRPEKLIGGMEHIGYVNKAAFEPELKARYLGSMTPRRNRFRLMEMIRHLPQGPRDMTVALHVPRLSEITQPVMLTWGEQDPLLAAGSGDRLAGDLRHCVFQKHPHLSHMPHEEAPDLIGKEWSHFLTTDP